MDIAALERSSNRLGDTCVDSRLWPNLLQEIARGAGGFGAMLLQSGRPTHDVPWSPSLDRMREVYYGEAWNDRDLRALRSVAAVRRGLMVLTDADVVTRDEFAHDPYYAGFIASSGLATFAAIVFDLSPSTVCGLVIQRTPSQGEFTQREKEALALLSPRLTATASLTRMVAESSIRGSLDMLGGLSRPALALGRKGAVLGVNSAATALFDDDFSVRAGKLVLRDEAAADVIRKACELPPWSFDRPAAMPEAIVVRRRGRLPLIMRPAAVDGPAAGFILGARLVVAVTDPEANALPPVETLRAVFGLTRSEAKLATHLAAGLTLIQAADLGSITVETARTHLKTVFVKTNTNRQAQLVALLCHL